MSAAVAIAIGVLILAAVAYDIARLITPAESRCPPLARLRGRRAALEHAERWSVGQVAPAALASTFATSVVGAATFALLSLTGSGDIAPDWYLGLACGLGGLAGGYLGAHLQPRLPETALRLLLGALASALGVLYAVQSLS
ncbi:hypothetical protein AS200_17030 [Streptomyces sp. CdTB01]|nr:hypothetical protein AS200_17030 [Streptomyces sp. CdTB01]